MCSQGSFKVHNKTISCISDLCEQLRAREGESSGPEQARDGRASALRQAGPLQSQHTFGPKVTGAQQNWHVIRGYLGILALPLHWQRMLSTLWVPLWTGQVSTHWPVLKLCAAFSPHQRGVRRQALKDMHAPKT